MTMKLREFSEGKIKIVNDSPVIAFKFSDKDKVLWDMHKISAKKAEKATELSKKLTIIKAELKEFLIDLEREKVEFWREFYARFDIDSQIQLRKMRVQVIPEEFEFHAYASINEKDRERNQRTQDFVDKIIGDDDSAEFGQEVGNIHVNKKWSRVEARTNIREQLARFLPKDVQDKIEKITDQMIEDIFDKKNSQGGLLVDDATGSVERLF